MKETYRPEHIFALRQSLAAYRYYQQLVLETDQEIQRQMVELEAADVPAWPDYTSSVTKERGLKQESLLKRKPDDASGMKVIDPTQ